MVEFYLDLNVPPKICVLIWRVLYGALPVGIQLLRRKVIIPSQCPCYEKEESISHVMVSCIFAKKVWKEVGLWGTIKMFLHKVAVEMLVAIWHNVSLEEFELCSILLWGLWS